MNKKELALKICESFKKIGDDVTYNERENILLLDGGLLCYQGKDGIVFNTDIIPNKALLLIEKFFKE